MPEPTAAGFRTHLLVAATTLLILALGSPARSAPGGPDFRFAIIGDRTGSATPGVWESVVDEIEMLGPAFVVSVGDHIEGYTEDPGELDKQWTGIDAILATLSVPFYPAPGNHDITTDGQLPAWRERTRREPCYSFDHEKVHFVILDTSRWESSAQWMQESGYADWLRADLEKNRAARLTVVVFHKPYWYDTLADGKPDPMHEIFRECGVDYVFNGHYHNYGAGTFDGIRYTILGASGGGIGDVDPDRGVFFQYAWCAVRGDSLDWRVMRPEGMLSERIVPVTDLKFLDKVASEYIQTRPFILTDPAQAGPAAFAVSIHNAGGRAWAAHARWDPAPGWSVFPDSTCVDLGLDTGLSASFQAQRTGSFYPLPRLRLDYPYGEGKTYHHNEPLPALRTQFALNLTAGTDPPKIDGRLDDACWERAVPATEFGDPAGGASTIEPTAFLFARDGNNLYVAARCVQKDGTPLALARERDAAVHRDDCVGFFLCSDPAEKTVHQIYFNAAGTIFDQEFVVEAPGQYGGPAAKWDGSYQVATEQGDGVWTVEAAIPFATLGAAAPNAGDRWRVNFRRKEISRGSSSDWQYPIGYEPSRFGYLSFHE